MFLLLCVLMPLLIMLIWCIVEVLLHFCGSLWLLTVLDLGGTPFVALTPSLCHILSRSSWKALISSPELFGFCMGIFVTIFNVCLSSYCPPCPPPVDVCICGWQEPILLASFAHHRLPHSCRSRSVTRLFSPQCSFFHCHSNLFGCLAPLKFSHCINWIK